MSKTFIIWLIVKAYFVAALFGSFTHIVVAAEFLGLHGWEAGIVPFLIDGMFVIAMVLRSETYSARTRRIGLRVQVAMGTLSLAANITATRTVGGILLAVLLVGGMIFSECGARRAHPGAGERARTLTRPAPGPQPSS
jgi:predicted membrane channel-forming protein YqfA (hemolysin III family)